MGRAIERFKSLSVSKVALSATGLAGALVLGAGVLPMLAISVLEARAPWLQLHPALKFVPVAMALVALIFVAAMRRRLVLFEEALNHAASAIVVFDRDDRLFFANTRFRELANTRAGDLTVGTPYETIARRMIRRGYCEEEARAELERRLRLQQNADGRPSDRRYENGRWFRVAKKRTPGGMVVGVGIDVTEYYLLKSNLAAEIRRFTALADCAPVGICQVSGRGSIQFVNEALLDLLCVDDEAALLTADLTFRRGERDLHGFTALLAALRVAQSEMQVAVLQTGRVVLIKNAPIPCGGLADILPREPGSGEHILIFVDITERTEAEERIRFLALHDPLTGAGNRAAFSEAITAAAKRASDAAPVTLIAIDLDGFKPVNDTLGHLAGDAVLKEIPKRVAPFLPHSMSLYRMGGDEFAILCRPDRRAEPQMVADAVAAALAEPFLCDGHSIAISASIGLSTLPRDTGDPETLLHYADLALYKVKREGGGGVCAFEPSLLDVIDERRMLEFELRDAIERNSFEIMYQAQYGARSTEPLAVEAFVRWRRRRTGALIRPNRFLGLARDLGLVERLDFLVIDRVLADFSKCLDGPNAPPAIAINISVKTLESAELERHLAHALSRHNVPGERVILELSENFAVESGANLTHSLHAIDALGVSLMLDDFGTGFTSLRLIADLPLKALKIDGSIARDLSGPSASRAERIVRPIIDMAHHLELTVVASGIESRQVYDALCELGCDRFQGHLLGDTSPSITAIATHSALDPRTAANDQGPRPGMAIVA